VQVSVSFKSDLTKNARDMQSALTFDLMAFTNEQDYLCYVEAVEILRKENRKQECDFIHNKEVFMSGMYAHEVTDEEFLKLEQRAKELFFVIDNTDYPECIFDDEWIPSPVSDDDKESHLFVDVHIATIFTSNDTFFFWNWVFIIIIISLGAMLGLSILCYCQRTWRYNFYVKERRKLKRELLKIKDTEYTNFLMRQSESLKSQQRNGVKYRGINASIATEEDVLDQESD